MTALDRITRRINRIGDPNDPTKPRALLTVSEFFDGNEVLGSIGRNLSPTPTPAEFRSVLMQIAQRPGVGDVRVQVTMFDDPAWPFSDTVWIMTSAEPSEVASWFPENMEPDSVDEGWAPGSHMRPVPCPQE